MASTRPTIHIPHAELTKIDGQPKPHSIQLLEQELYDLFGSVHSYRGGGNHGHLGAITSPAEYLTLSGQALPWIPPTNPVPFATAGLTQAAIAQQQMQQAADRDDWLIYTELMQLASQLIRRAIDDTYLAALKQGRMGYANVKPLDFLDHLRDEYGKASGADLEKNREAISEAWNPEQPLLKLWNKIDNCRDIATTAGEPITDTATMALALRALRAAGVYGNAITLWETQDPTNKTWPNFRKHFNSHDKARLRALETSRLAGYHQANLVYTSAGLPVDIQHIINVTTQAANASTPTNDENTPPHCHKCNNATTDNSKPKPTPTGSTSVYYCWSHGLTLSTANHTSASCKTPAENHIKTATLANQQGGSKSIHLLQPSRLRNPNRRRGQPAE